jgi:transcriptional regulator with XRE-family HTH domain
MADRPETIGQRIRRFREERGLTPSALAEEAGVAKSYLSALENDHGGTNHRRPSADTLYRLAQVLGVAMSDLLGRPIITENASARPKSLVSFAKRRSLPEADIEMLAGIRFRGDEPQTPERWEFIYQAIKNSAPMDRPTRARPNKR